MPRPHEAVAGALLALALAACGSSQRYADLPEKNLQVHTSATGARVVMGVHSLDAKCAAGYEGVVALDRPLVEVGLPPGRQSLLVFEFYSSSLLSGSSSTKKEARIVPRAGYRYEARVNYRDAMYDVELREVDPRSGSGRELDIRRRCQP
jgi:hypothetical protein